MEDIGFDDEEGVNWKSFSNFLLKTSIQTLEKKMGQIRKINRKAMKERLEKYGTGGN